MYSKLFDETLSSVALEEDSENDLSFLMIPENHLVIYMSTSTSPVTKKRKVSQLQSA